MGVPASEPPPNVGEGILLRAHGHAVGERSDLSHDVADFAPGFSKITILNPKTNGNFYFNPATFQAIQDAYNPSDPYGTTTRDFFRGPSRTNLDMALAKTTAITEHVNVEFRLEAFNVLNHTELANPDVNIADLNFGLITSTTLGSGPNALQTQRILQLGGRLTF